MTLYDAPKNREYTVVSISDSAGLLTGRQGEIFYEQRKLREMGIIDGGRIYVLGRAFGGGVIVRLRGYTAVIRRDFTKLIQLETVRRSSVC